MKIFIDGVEYQDAAYTISPEYTIPTVPRNGEYILLRKVEPKEPTAQEKLIEKFRSDFSKVGALVGKQMMYEGLGETMLSTFALKPTDKE